MGLYFNNDVNSLYLGSNEVSSLYFGSTQLWPVGLPVGTTFNFDYTGDVQSVTLPRGRYKLQCWGAQGGNVTGSYVATGSKGGYSEGILKLDKEKTLYVFVGGKGTDYSYSNTSTSLKNGGWNGGGASVRYSEYSGICSWPRAGGGATDIALVSSDMSYISGVTNRSSESLLSRFIVAGGGGGASYAYGENFESERVTLEGYTEDIGSKYGPCYNPEYTLASYQRDSYVSIDLPFDENKVRSRVYNGSTLLLDTYDLSYYIDAAATKIKFNIWTSSGEVDYPATIYLDFEWSDSFTSVASTSNSYGGGTSGKGQYPGTQTTGGNSGGKFGFGANQTTTNYKYCSGAGGGGWYGGGMSYSDNYTSYISYTGGGSGFVNIASNASYRPSNYTGLELESGTTTAGDSSFPSTSGVTETGHSGNGYARITVI